MRTVEPLHFGNKITRTVMLHIRVPLVFPSHKKICGKITAVFRTLFHSSSFLFNSLKFSEEDMNRVNRTMERYLLAQTREYGY